MKSEYKVIIQNTVYTLKRVCLCASAFLGVWSRSDQGFPVPGVFRSEYSLDPLEGLLSGLASAKEVKIPQFTSKPVEVWDKWAGTVPLTA